MRAKDFNYWKCIPNDWTQMVLDVLCFNKIYTSRGCGMRQAYQKSFRLASFLGKSGVVRSFIWQWEKTSAIPDWASCILGGGTAATKLVANCKHLGPAPLPNLLPNCCPGLLRVGAWIQTQLIWINMKTQTPDPLAAPKLLPIHCPGPRCVGVLMFLQSTCRIRCFFRSRKSEALKTFHLMFKSTSLRIFIEPKSNHRLFSQSVTPRFDFC